MGEELEMKGSEGAAGQTTWSLLKCNLHPPRLTPRLTCSRSYVYVLEYSSVWSLLQKVMGPVRAHARGWSCFLVLNCCEKCSSLVELFDFLCYENLQMKIIAAVAATLKVPSRKILPVNICRDLKVSGELLALIIFLADTLT